VFSVTFQFCKGRYTNTSLWLWFWITMTNDNQCKDRLRKWWHILQWLLSIHSYRKHEIKASSSKRKTSYIMNYINTITMKQTYWVIAWTQAAMAASCIFPVLQWTRLSTDCSLLHTGVVVWSVLCSASTAVCSWWTVLFSSALVCDDFCLLTWRPDKLVLSVINIHTCLKKAQIYVSITQANYNCFKTILNVLC